METWDTGGYTKTLKDEPVSLQMGYRKAALPCKRIGDQQLYMGLRRGVAPLV